MKLRKHQRELESHLDNIQREDLPLRILSHVIPGGGKSLLPALLYERFPNLQYLWSVPRLSLQEQAIGDLALRGITFRDSGNEVNPARGTSGVVTTMQGITSDVELWVDYMGMRPTGLIIDEPHHLKRSMNASERNAYAKAFAKLIPMAEVVLFMTGTLKVADRSFIDWCEYEIVPDGWIVDREATADICIRYDRPTAIREKAVARAKFYHHDGEVQWAENGIVQPAVDISKVAREDEGKAIMTMMRTPVAMTLLETAIDGWRRDGRPNGYKLLVLGADQTQCRKFYKEMTKKGIDTALMITDEEDSKGEVRRFKSTAEAAVTCQMGYEGLNVPKVSHLAVITHIRSEPWLEQAFGRAWRAILDENGNHQKPLCHIYVPKDPRMDRVIEAIRREQDQIMAPGTDGPPPPPAPGSTIYAVSGNIRAMDESYLDGMPDDPAFRQAVAALRATGAIFDEQELLEFVDSRRPKQQFAKATPREQERIIKNSVNAHCRAYAEQNGIEYFAVFGRLKDRTGKSVTDMSFDEAKDALRIAVSMFVLSGINYDKFLS